MSTHNFMNKFIKIYAVCMGFILALPAVSSASVCFLPNGECSGNMGGATAVYDNMGNCVGYDLTVAKGEGWDCESCNERGVTKYLCTPKKCPKGEHVSGTPVRVSRTNKDVGLSYDCKLEGKISEDTNNISGDYKCKKCVNPCGGAGACIDSKCGAFGQAISFGDRDSGIGGSGVVGSTPVGYTDRRVTYNGNTYLCRIKDNFTCPSGYEKGSCGDVGECKICVEENGSDGTTPCRKIEDVKGCPDEYPLTERPKNKCYEAKTSCNRTCYKELSCDNWQCPTGYREDAKELEGNCKREVARSPDSTVICYKPVTCQCGNGWTHENSRDSNLCYDEKQQMDDGKYCYREAKCKCPTGYDSTKPEECYYEKTLSDSTKCYKQLDCEHGFKTKDGKIVIVPVVRDHVLLDENNIIIDYYTNRIRVDKNKIYDETNSIKEHINKFGYYSSSDGGGIGFLPMEGRDFSTNKSGVKLPLKFVASSYDHDKIYISCKSDSLMMCSGTAVASVFEIEHADWANYYNEEKDSYNATKVTTVKDMWGDVKYVFPDDRDLKLNLNNIKEVPAIDKCYRHGSGCPGELYSYYGASKTRIRDHFMKRYPNYTMNSAPIYHECPMGIYAIKKERDGMRCAKGEDGNCGKADDKSRCFPNLYRLNSSEAKQFVDSYRSDPNCRETHYFRPYFKLYWEAYMEGGKTEKNANSSLNHYNAIIDSGKGIYGFIFTNNQKSLAKAMDAFAVGKKIPDIPFIVMTNLMPEGESKCTAQGAEFTKFVSTSDRSFSNTECVKCLLEDGEIAGYSKVRNVTECVEKCSKVTPDEKDFYAECIRLEKRGELGKNGVEGQTICDAVALGIMEKRLGDK